MTTQANNNKGTFSQLPTVFIDTCDLPDAQQMVFIRLWKETFNGVNEWQGSTRKLAKIARVSVGTAFSAKKILEAAGLVEVSPVPNEHNNADSFKISIKHQALWALNDLYCKGAKVEKWKVLPHVDSVQILNRGVQSVTQVGVQIMNDNVQILNRGCSNNEQSQAQGCSKFEQGCSIDKLKSTPYIGTLDNIDPTYNRSVDKGVNPHVVNDAHSHTSLFPENELPPLETTEPEPPVSPNGQKPTKPERPARPEKGKGNVTNEPPAPAKPKTGLDAHTDQERAFWTLWLNADQNKKVPPQYKDSASDHIKTLALQITTQEQMDSLVKSTRASLRKKLNLPNLWKIELGNCRNHFPDWDKAQEKENKPASPPASPEKIVLWTRKPDSPLFKIDPAVWYLFEEMPLAEARQYNYDLYGGLPGDVQTRIRVNYDRESRGELKRPELVA